MTSLYQTAVTGTTVHGSYAQILATGNIAYLHTEKQNLMKLEL